MNSLTFASLYHICLTALPSSDISEYLGVSRRTVSHYISTRADVPHHVADEMAKLAQVVAANVYPPVGVQASSERKAVYHPRPANSAEKQDNCYCQMLQLAYLQTGRFMVVDNG